MKIIITLMAAIILFCELAIADCFFNGVAYETGQTVGVFVCTDSGWKKQ